MVMNFHKKYGFYMYRILHLELYPDDPNATLLLTILESNISNIAKEMETLAAESSKRGDERLHCAQLIAEEAGEVMKALLNGDEVECADALGDLLYVTIGTAVTYGIPIEEVFNEIHKSNMTKIRNPNDPNDSRMRKKDPHDGYIKPDISKAIKEGRHGINTGV